MNLKLCAMFALMFLISCVDDIAGASHATANFGVINSEDVGVGTDAEPDIAFLGTKCKLNSDCEDNNPCTNEICFGTQCLYLPVQNNPECVECNQNTDCHDIPVVYGCADNKTTMKVGDSCIHGACTYQVVSLTNCEFGCGQTSCNLCATDIDCDDKNCGTADFCISGQCKHHDVGGCGGGGGDGDCATDADCNNLKNAIACPSYNIYSPTFGLYSAVAKQYTGKCLQGACEMAPFNCSDGDPNTLDKCSTSEPADQLTYTLGECIHPPLDPKYPYTECWCADVHYLCVKTSGGEVISQSKVACENGCGAMGCM